VNECQLLPAKADTYGRGAVTGTAPDPQPCFAVKGDVNDNGCDNRIHHLCTDNDWIVCPGKCSFSARAEATDAVDNFSIKAAF
jgi:hypothetical protein